MIDSSITVKLIQDGVLKKCYILFEGVFIECLILKTFKVDKINCVKLKPSKKYPLGHNFLIRSINECY